MSNCQTKFKESNLKHLELSEKYEKYNGRCAAVI